MATEYLETYPLHSLTNLFPLFAIRPQGLPQDWRNGHPVRSFVGEGLMKNALPPLILRMHG